MLTVGDYGLLDAAVARPSAWAAAWTFLHINGVELGVFDVDDAEVFMNDVATDGTVDIAYIADKLAGYAGRGG